MDGHSAPARGPWCIAHATLPLNVSPAPRTESCVLYRRRKFRGITKYWSRDLSFWSIRYKGAHVALTWKSLKCIITSIYITRRTKTLKPYYSMSCHRAANISTGRFPDPTSQYFTVFGSFILVQLKKFQQETQSSFFKLHSWFLCHFLGGGMLNVSIFSSRFKSGFGVSPNSICQCSDINWSNMFDISRAVLCYSGRISNFVTASNKLFLRQPGGSVVFAYSVHSAWPLLGDFWTILIIFEPICQCWVSLVLTFSKYSRFFLCFPILFVYEQNGSRI